ncbi:MAG: cation:proton antiporter [Verrucomicrobiota bacterium]
MFSEGDSLVTEIGWWICAIIFLAAAIPVVFRIVRGPTIFDRIVALDLFAGICLGIIVALSIRFDEPVFLEVAFVIALVGFLGTVALARFLERGGEQ